MKGLRGIADFFNRVSHALFGPEVLALMGGSFNPLTDSHLAGAHWVKQALHPDEMRLEFSENPIKKEEDPHGYAPVGDRMEMARVRLSFHPEYKFTLANDEDRLGTHYTYEVLTKLQKENPDKKLIWVMGSDNFTKFMKWHHKDELLREFAFAVLRRESRPEDKPGEDEFHAAFDVLQRRNAAEALKKGGWFMLGNPLIPGSSTGFRKTFQAGGAFDAPSDRAVAQYARDHGLYRTKPAPVPPLPAL